MRSRPWERRVVSTRVPEPPQFSGALRFEPDCPATQPLPGVRDVVLQLQMVLFEKGFVHRAKRWRGRRLAVFRSCAPSNGA